MVDTNRTQEYQEISELFEFKSFKNKSILITGASGLIGNYLLNFLSYLNDNLGLNMKITALSREGSYLVINKNMKNLSLLSGDLTDFEFSKTIPRSDIVIHGAGYGQPGKFMADTRKTMLLNSNVTDQLINKTNEIFLFLSTSEIYSGLTNISCQENMVGTTNTDHPRAAYIESKRFGESLTSLANQDKNLRGEVARIALAYGPGPRNSDSRVLNQFITRAINEKIIRLLDDGSAIRTYCYVKDTLIQLLSITLNGNRSIYNVAGVSKVTISELAAEIGLQMSIPVILGPKGSGLESSPTEVVINIDKVLSIGPSFEFTPLPVGLKKTIEWFQILNKESEGK